MKVVMDCDNTIGIPGRDLDDALAIFYLLGRDDVEMIGVTTKHPQRITVLATEAMTNLLGAWQVYHDFFRNLKADVLMEGATGALFINGQTMDELKFSCDAEAAYRVLRSDSNTTAITGNLCLQAPLDGKRFGRINVPTELRDRDRFWDELFRAWENAL